MANNIGGARPGAGRPKGARAITADLLHEAIKKATTQTYDEIVAETLMIVFTDFKTTKNPKGMMAFMKIFTPYLCEPPAREVGEEEQADEKEIDARIGEILKKAMGGKE